MTINGVEAMCTNGEMSENELTAYVNRGRERYGDNLVSVKVEIDGEEVNIGYTYHREKFKRLRRITGYLVGDMSRWNDGKKAEENDRVKHSV